VRIIYAILGFPPDEEARERFSTWALNILSGPQIDAEKAEQSRRAAFQAAQDLYDHVLPIVAQRRAEGAQGMDMIATLLRAEHQGQGLSDGDVASFIRMLLPAAAETTTRSFSNLLALLLQRPALMAQIRADRSLIPAAINEAMRYETPVGFLAREAIHDVEIGGVSIPAGAGLSLVVSSGNRDEAVFADGDCFDIFRKPAPALGFGYGVHMCIGMAVAKTEMQAAVNALFDRFPALEADGDPPQIVGAHFRSPTALRVCWG
jgi:cytochrome P450